jgi:hypothetical protein
VSGEGAGVVPRPFAALVPKLPFGNAWGVAKLSFGQDRSQTGVWEQGYGGILSTALPKGAGKRNLLAHWGPLSPSEIWRGYPKNRSKLRIDGRLRKPSLSPRGGKRWARLLRGSLPCWQEKDSLGSTLSGWRLVAQPARPRLGGSHRWCHPYKQGGQGVRAWGGERWHERGFVAPRVCAPPYQSISAPGGGPSSGCHGAWPPFLPSPGLPLTSRLVVLRDPGTPAFLPLCVIPFDSYNGSGLNRVVILRHWWHRFS